LNCVVARKPDLRGVDVVAIRAAVELLEEHLLRLLRGEESRRTCALPRIRRVLHERHALGRDERAFGRIDDLDVLLAAGHVLLRGVFHRHADGEFTLRHAFVDLRSGAHDGRVLRDAFDRLLADRSLMPQSVA
jgi:hypothetical protein